MHIPSLTLSEIINPMQYLIVIGGVLCIAWLFAMRAGLGSVQERLDLLHIENETNPTIVSLNSLIPNTRQIILNAIVLEFLALIGALFIANMDIVAFLKILALFGAVVFSYYEVRHIRLVLRKTSAQLDDLQEANTSGAL